MIHLVNLWLHFKNVLKKSTVWDMKVTTDCGPVMLLLLFVCFILKWCFCCWCYITYFASKFKLQGFFCICTSKFIHLGKIGIFSPYSILWVNFYYTVYHGPKFNITSLQNAMIFNFEDTTCCFEKWYSFGGWGVGVGCSHFEKAKKIFNPTLQFTLA